MPTLPSSFQPRASTRALGFVSDQSASGKTWTLTTILGEFIADLEDRYGPRDMAYTLLGIEFRGGTPCIWFPGNRKHIAIVLTETARDDCDLAIWQLAHEAVQAALGCHRLLARAQRCEPPSPEKRSTIQRSGDSPCGRIMATSLPSSRMKSVPVDTRSAGPRICITSRAPSLNGAPR